MRRCFEIDDNDANLVWYNNNNNNNNKNLYLVKGNHVYAATEVDVFSVQAIDSLLLQALLRKSIVRCQR